MYLFVIRPYNLLNLQHWSFNLSAENCLAFLNHDVKYGACILRSKWEMTCKFLHRVCILSFINYRYCYLIKFAIIWDSILEAELDMKWNCLLTEIQKDNYIWQRPPWMNFQRTCCKKLTVKCCLPFVELCFYLFICLKINVRWVLYSTFPPNPVGYEIIVSYAFFGLLKC